MTKLVIIPCLREFDDLLFYFLKIQLWHSLIWKFTTFCQTYNNCRLVYVRLSMIISDGDYEYGGILSTWGWGEISINKKELDATT